MKWAWWVGFLVLLGCNEPDVVRVAFDVNVPEEAVETTARPPGTCPPGASLGCVTPYSRKLCNEEGTAFEEQPCPAGQICFGDSECRPAQCIPGSSTCLSPDKVGTCTEDGADYVHTDTCKVGLNCIEGECLASCNSAVKAQTNVGCNYALVDLGNYESKPQGSDSDHPVVVVVSNTSDRQTASLSFSFSGSSEASAIPSGDMLVPPQELRTYLLPTGLAQLDTSINRSSWILTSDSPITVHLINPENGPDVRSNDATVLFPTDALGTDYRVMSWKSFWTEASGYDADGYPKYGFPSYITVVGTSQGETVVELTPTAAIRAGMHYDGDAMAKVESGQTVSYTLLYGDVLNVTMEPQLGTEHDLTGTKVQSDRPIAVFAAHNCAFVPDIQVKFCDHLEHQLAPVDTWNSSYVADQFEPRPGEAYDVWRIMAAYDETVVSTDPLVPEVAGILLNAGEWVEYTAPFPHFIQATGPIQVGHYMTGSNIPGFDPVCGDQLTGIGDPAFTIGVGLEQYLDNYLVLTPAGYTDDWINVVRSAGTTVRLDGEPIVGDGVLVGNTSLELIRIPVEDGVHRLTSESPFGVTAYGYDCDVSYAYPGGMLLTVVD